MKQQVITIHSDGGARGNPGPAAYGFVLTDSEKNIIFQEGKYIGNATNNVAEYTGVLKSLEWVAKNITDLASLEIILDSELVARQMTGIYKVKNDQLKKFYHQIKLLEQQINVPIRYTSVPRSQNKDADRLVNLALDTQANYS